MTRNHKALFLVLAIALLATGCKKFLDVQPEDKYTEEQVYSSEKAIQQALNGLYFNLASNELYGANLTGTAVEVLGQRYWTVAGGNNTTPFLQAYTYANAGVMDQFDNLWKTAYATITKANKFISSLEEAAAKGVISRQHADQLAGEATGIRALLHFDLLRLFGPVMSISPTANAIPYYKKADALPTAILPAGQVIDSVLADLARARQLLSADPVIAQGVKTGSEFYGDARNQRLNYYAVTALQARVYLYAGKTAEANQAARDALANGEKWFPWLPYTSVINTSMPNRIFSTEVMFGVYNQNMYTNYTSFFAPDLSQYQIFIPYPARLKNIFGEGEGLLSKDYRYLSSFSPGGPPIGVTQEIGLTFNKFASLSLNSYAWKFIQPLIRKTELYYILAETEPDPAVGLELLNTVRFNRGLPAIAGASNLAAEIQKEYQKEFWGEGQIFFYYKRKASASIPSGVSTGNISMSGSGAAKYVVPLPLSETTPR
jgi:hypothetical protein